MIMSEFKFSCPNCDQHIACDESYHGIYADRSPFPDALFLFHAEWGKILGGARLQLNVKTPARHAQLMDVA